MNAFILRAPVITEKSMFNAKAGSVYTFYVASTATKKQVAEAVKNTFGVDVVAVRTAALYGKSKRTGKKRITRQQTNKKKAMVTLKAGQTIAIFDVQEKA